jgi:hypothetical protein
MNRTHIISALAAIVAASFTAQLASALVIDTFTDQQSVLQTGVGTTSNTVVAPGALGGFRFGSVNVTAGAGAGSISVNNVIPGAVAVSSNAGVNANFNIAYGTSAPLAADLTVGGNAFLIQVLSSDIGSVNNSLTITTGAASSTAAFTVPSLVGQTGGPATPYSILVPYSSFVGTASFTNVSTIDIDLNTPSNGDWAVQYFATASVPEASSVGLLAPIGLLLARRRRA